MIRVALTGGIGSGKTLICKVFENLGIPVFYADQKAKEIMNSDIILKEKLISYFGAEIFDQDENLIRRKFAEIIFNNKSSLLKVNEIVHPAVRKEFNLWTERQLAPYVIEETAIVFESGQAHYFDKIISVTSPMELRIERVMKRDNINRDKVIARLKHQFNDEQKNDKSDFIIVNDEKEMVLPQIINIHSKLK